MQVGSRGSSCRSDLQTRTFGLAGILLLAGLLFTVSSLQPGPAAAVSSNSMRIVDRHRDMTREQAESYPKREEHQAIVDDWPLYRTERGQQAFNRAMATLHVTESPAPDAAVFKGCRYLNCNLDLPKLTSRGWIPSGRIWISPNEYVLIVHSSRRSRGRRSHRSMRYFVFHEFHNSTGNVDLYDTISAHRRSVFVPFYLGKPGRDVHGNRYVVVVQVAPHDVISIHASVFGSAGPGIEVAKNSRDRLGKLQAAAGVLVASIVMKAEPHLRVVNHRGTEGRPMLRAYQSQRAAARRYRGAVVKLPFVAADRSKIARAAVGLGDLIVRDGVSPTRFAMREKRRPVLVAASMIPRLVSVPKLVRVAQQPVLTMETLIARIFARDRLVPPRPQPVCRSMPGFACYRK